MTSKLRLIHNLKDLQPPAASLQSVHRPIILVCGTFDGVHLGHQALIRRAQEEAAACGGRVVVMTFDQHPAMLLRPERAPRLLTTTAEKLKLIEALGIDTVLLLPFDEALAATPAEQFIQQLAVAAHPLQAICVGAAWSFGQGGKGNLVLLQQLGKELHFEVITIDPIQVDGVVVSSTRIRKAVAEGHLNEAAACLGRHHALTGLVIRGAGRAKEFGFPTANLSAKGLQLSPNGVYAVIAHLETASYHGIANIGYCPTICALPVAITVEAHLFDFEGDLYGQELKIELVSFLRSEIAFPDLEDLRLQIIKDVAIVKKILSP